MEYWDLYDINRQKTGESLRSSELIPVGRYHLIVHLALFNSEGLLLSQKRQRSKTYWPGLWDLTVSGSVLAGESSEEGIRREAMEELGLDLGPGLLKAKATVNGYNYFDDYFVLHADPELGALRLQEEEVSAVRWLSREELKALSRKGQFTPYNLSFIDYLFDLSEGICEENFDVLISDGREA